MVCMHLESPIAPEETAPGTSAQGVQWTRMSSAVSAVKPVPLLLANQLLPCVSSADGASPGERLAKRRVICQGGKDIHILI